MPSGSNCAKYCPACAVRVRRKTEAERQRKRYHHSMHLGAEKALEINFFVGVKGNGVISNLSVISTSALPPENIDVP